MTEITVNYSDTEGFEILVKGHAGYGKANGLPLGCDIVCSAISTLSCTLIEKIGKLEDMGKIEAMHIKCDPGDVEVRVKAHKKYSGELGSVVDTILTGFHMLSVDFSSFVSLKNEGGGNNFDNVIC